MSHRDLFPIDENEEYATAYFYFLEALKVLSYGPQAQCEAMGNINVAWEIKDDVSRGSYLLSMTPNKLSVEQAHAISELLDSLKTIPEAVLKSATSFSDNERAMNHPCWTPLRVMASNLIKLLENP